jgi:hypothetical protein
MLWREESKHNSASHQWLEEHIGGQSVPNDEFILDLYMPIAE